MSHITDKLYNKKWGIFNHYLWNQKEDWIERVNNFDVKKLAKNLNEVGAGYYFITIMQGSRVLLAPNKTYDDIMGFEPGILSPRRDVIAELGEELAKYDIDLYLYYTGDGPHKDDIGGKKFGFRYNVDEIWTDHGIVMTKDPITKDFCEKWTAVLEEYTVRYGDMVNGWWMDGFYGRQFGYTPELIKMYYDAVKKGNKNAICGFNNGVKKELERWTEYSEFTAGEFNEYCFIPKERFFEGAQAHILAPLGEKWSHPDTNRYDAKFMRDYIDKVNSNGGVVTVEIHIEPDGSFSDEQETLLKKMQTL